MGVRSRVGPELTEQGADEQIDKLAKKYLGKDEYPWRKPDETRVKVLIEPQIGGVEGHRRLVLPKIGG